MADFKNLSSVAGADSSTAQTVACCQASCRIVAANPVGVAVSGDLSNQRWCHCTAMASAGGLQGAWAALVTAFHAIEPEIAAHASALERLQQQAVAADGALQQIRESSSASAQRVAELERELEGERGLRIAAEKKAASLAAEVNSERRQRLTLQQRVQMLDSNRQKQRKQVQSLFAQMAAMASAMSGSDSLSQADVGDLEAQLRAGVDESDGAAGGAEADAAGGEGSGAGAHPSQQRAGGELDFVAPELGAGSECGAASSASAGSSAAVRECSPCRAARGRLGGGRGMGGATGDEGSCSRRAEEQGRLRCRLRVHVAASDP